MNEVVVSNLIKEPYASKEEAWRLVRNGLPSDVRAFFGLSKSGFLGHEYTQAAPDEGFLMAWWSVPILVVDAPRPASVNIRRNGWVEVPDEDLRALRDGAGEVDESFWEL